MSRPNADTTEWLLKMKRALDDELRQLYESLNAEDRELLLDAFAEEQLRVRGLSETSLGGKLSRKSDTEHSTPYRSERANGPAVLQAKGRSKPASATSDSPPKTPPVVTSAGRQYEVLLSDNGVILLRGEFDPHWKAVIMGGRTYKLNETDAPNIKRCLQMGLASFAKAKRAHKGPEDLIKFV